MRSGSTAFGSRQLICIPYAGGGAAAFSGWAKALGADVEVCGVQLPGRENRFRETPFESLAPLVAAVAEGIRPILDEPFSIYGHSLGGIIGFELARYSRSHFGREPENLIVSAVRAPQLPYPFSFIGKLPEPEFIAEIGTRYEPVPEEILRDEEMLRLTMPVLRADFSVFETYEYVDAPPLACKIHVLGGEQDRMVSRDALDAWRVQTTGAHTVTVVPGGHFFIREQRERVWRRIREILQASFQ
jgi:medium-chain acyl-[acyl-carrier-protein] hydrolase